MIPLADHGDRDGQPAYGLGVHGEGDDGDDAAANAAGDERAAVAFDAAQSAQEGDDHHHRWNLKVSHFTSAAQTVLVQRQIPRQIQRRRWTRICPRLGFWS